MAPIRAHVSRFFEPVTRLRHSTVTLGVAALFAAHLITAQWGHAAALSAFLGIFLFLDFQRAEKEQAHMDVLSEEFSNLADENKSMQTQIERLSCHQSPAPGRGQGSPH